MRNGSQVTTRLSERLRRRLDVIVLIIALLILITTPLATDARSTPSWHVQANFGYDLLSGIGCGSATDCWTTGQGGIWATSDAGRNWRLQRVPGTGLLESVACISAARCWAVGDAEAIATDNAGRVWRQEPLPRAVASLYSVACVGRSICWAVGAAKRPVEAGIALVSHTGGATWGLQRLPSGTTTLVKISCISSARCWALDLVRQTVVSTRDGGHTWRAHILPSGAGVEDLACSPPTHCVAVGDKVLVTADGTSWKGTTIPRGIPTLGAVACISPSQCRAAARIGPHYQRTGEIIATADGGRTWRRERTPARARGVIGPSTLACVSAGRCWAADFPSIVLTTGPD